nr:immunoglobulin heavy chain junction region [Mus musculus]
CARRAYSTSFSMDYW